jgi:hypothetical protein
MRAKTDRQPRLEEVRFKAYTYPAPNGLCLWIAPSVWSFPVANFSDCRCHSFDEHFTHFICHSFIHCLSSLYLNITKSILCIMDTFYTPNTHTSTAYQQPLRLADVSDPAFTIINDFLNVCSSKGIPFSWVVNVYHRESVKLKPKAQANSLQIETLRQISPRMKVHQVRLRDDLT